MSNWKPNLDAFRDRPDLVFVIDRFNYVEHVLNEILLAYVKPDPTRLEFVRTYVLNTAVIPFGAKMKLFAHINAGERWGVSMADLHRLCAIRNQFAHTGSTLVTAVLDSTGHPIPDHPEAGVKLILESVTSSGKLQKVDAAVALDEFTQLFVGLKGKLNEIWDALRSPSATEGAQ